VEVSKHQSNLSTLADWCRKHVFDDLKPYVCIIEDCKETATLYSQSGTWAQHVASHLSLALRSSECLFCYAVFRHGGPAYYKHVSTHLREVSLSVLPQQADDDDFDNDDSNSPSSAKVPEGLHLDTYFAKKIELKEDQHTKETKAEEYQSRLPSSPARPPLSPISSVTSLGQYRIPDWQHELQLPLEVEVVEADSGPTTEASASSKNDVPSLGKIKIIYESASASQAASVPEVIGITSGLLTLAGFAFKSTQLLYQTINSFQTNKRVVRELKQELEALMAVLESLRDVTTDTDTTFDALKLTLLRCGNICKDFDAVIVKCVSHSEEDRKSFRDWVKLQYMGDDIDGFKRMLATYKSIISIALGDANLYA
jgi:Fungal N-terminal domain of STAND proteins